jgi:hypothetical protein
LHGNYKAFYNNGKLKEEGKFNNGEKVGEWRYWYKNGKLYKIIIFDKNDYFLKELYKPNGKLIVKDGNGNFVDKQLIPNFTLKGEIKNGKQDGNWYLINSEHGSKTCVELFENGKFVEGRNIGVDVQFPLYTDFPYTYIDLTKDLIDFSYLQKVICTNTFYFNEPTFNSKTSEIPFYDYINQNFFPHNKDQGYTILSYELDEKAKIININYFSSLQNNEVNEQLVTLVQASDQWRIRDKFVNNYRHENLLIIQFDGPTYKILNDSRFENVVLERGARFEGGYETLINYIEKSISLPKSFLEPNFNLSISIGIKIDQEGKLFVDNSIFNSLINVSEEEKILNKSLTEILNSTAPNWAPAYANGGPQFHSFTGVFLIKNGIKTFKLISNYWVLK